MSVELHSVNLLLLLLSYILVALFFSDIEVALVFIVLTLPLNIFFKQRLKAVLFLIDTGYFGLRWIVEKL